jgi:predicted CoA-binding protein
MDFFFNPKVIAVVGATPNPFKGGCSILKNLIAGYQGRIYPINPRYDKIEGLPAFPSVSAVDGPVDLAIVFVPAQATPDAIEDCIRKGVSGIIIESGGFAETGPEGPASGCGGRTAWASWTPFTAASSPSWIPGTSRLALSRAMFPSWCKAACYPPVS